MELAYPKMNKDESGTMMNEMNLMPAKTISNSSSVLKMFHISLI